MANTKNMKERTLEAEGEMDYDYLNDILFFKVKEREYDFSFEFQNMVVDIDKEKFIVGIQIFSASKFLCINKINLRQIPKWQFKARISQGVIEIRLFYQICVRNKIIEKTPIIIQENKSNLPSPQLVVTQA
ncbi:DUF2283 domain-containing protein [Candidatus Pacearchaeota archaeon]|nr:DUF2283 domain-containing protein [Candidatus Pacearchaeota archaeon]